MSNITKEEALEFLMSQKGGVVSTVSGDQPHSAYVFYDADDDFSVYFGTSVGSKKSLDIKENNKVAFVVQTIDPPKTIQIHGEATEVEKREVLENALANYVDVATYQMKNSAPITKLDTDGKIILFKIRPTWVKWSDYSDSRGSKASVVILGDSK